MAVLWFLGVGFLGVWIGTILDRRRFSRIAEGRPPTNWDQLVSDLIAAGASLDTATYLTEEIKPYYVRKLTPYCDDRLFSTLQIDPEDIEDLVAEYWRLRGWLLPSATEPQLIPADPSLVEFALWLERAGKVEHAT
ncbi:MAG: hypothetical protein ABIO43_10015 [Sphingomicrobium sp.]